jgi:GNAT superfamily N-acetyltransferase
MTDVSSSSRAWCSAGRRGQVLFHETTFSSLRFEGSALFAQHWLEASADRSVPLDVDWDRYAWLEEQKHEVCIAARMDGILVGYAVYLWWNHLHYSGLKVAEADAFFLREEDRNGWVGIKLFRFAEEALRQRGIEEVHQRVKLHVRPGRGRSDLGPLFEYLGYRPVETTYRKRIA